MGRRSRAARFATRRIPAWWARYGCLVVLPENLPIDQQVVVVNLANEQTIPGTVVWRGTLRDEGWELGIELSQPPLDFWGLEL